MTLQLTVFPKVTYRFNTTPKGFSAGDFAKIDKLLLKKAVKKCRGPKIALIHFF
jgi:hypothetical protein